jgi:hypothetical protein
VNKRTGIVVLVIVAAALFFVSGLRYVPGTLSTFSGAMCGPLTDGNGKIVGDAGPCRTFPPPVPQPHGDPWGWAPFWVPPDR